MSCGNNYQIYEHDIHKETSVLRMVKKLGKKPRTEAIGLVTPTTVHLEYYRLSAGKVLESFTQSDKEKKISPNV